MATIVTASCYKLNRLHLLIVLVPAATASGATTTTSHLACAYSCHVAPSPWYSNHHSLGTEEAAASPVPANATNATEGAPPPVPPCTDTCTKCDERVDPFLAVDGTCATCSRIAPEEEGQELGACVLFGPQTVSPLNGPTAGGYMLTITGEYFGATSSAPGVSAKIGDTSCAGLEWISRTSISCKVPGGVGTPKVSVAVGKKGDGSWAGQCTNCGLFVSMPEGTFKYDPPTVAKVKQPRKGYRPPEGNFPVTLTGTGFGTFDTAADGVLKGVVESFYGGDAASTSATWTSDSSVIVKAPEGLGVKRPISVIVGGQSSACADAQPATGEQTTAPPHAEGGGDSSAESTTDASTKRITDSPAEQSAGSSEAATGGRGRLLEGADAELAETTPPPEEGGSGNGTEMGGGGSGDAGGASAGACSTAATVDYDIPYLKRVRPALSPRDGGRKVTLQGSGFGPAPPSPQDTQKEEVESGKRREDQEVDSSSADNSNSSDTTASSAATDTSSSAATNSSTPADSVVGGGGQVKAGISVKGMRGKIGETECVTV